jgi:hypothetical protein
MTHGDKAKAKKTASKASESSKSTKVEGGQPPKISKTRDQEGGGKAGQAGSKAVQTEKRQQSGSGEKGAAAKALGAAKAGAGGSSSNSKVRSDAPGGISNPIVANAFKRAIKKYPNAFRRLTD